MNYDVFKYYIENINIVDTFKEIRKLKIDVVVTNCIVM